MTRIIYKECGGRLISQEILCNNQFVSIFLFPKELKYGIYNDDDLLKEGSANTLVSLKKRAKQAVKDLGATFYSEVRNRGSTERYGTK